MLRMVWSITTASRQQNLIYTLLSGTYRMLTLPLCPWFAGDKDGTGVTVLNALVETWTWPLERGFSIFLCVLRWWGGGCGTLRVLGTQPLGLWPAKHQLSPALSRDRGRAEGLQMVSQEGWVLSYIGQPCGISSLHPSHLLTFFLPTPSSSSSFTSHFFFPHKLSAHFLLMGNPRTVPEFSHNAVSDGTPWIT